MTQQEILAGLRQAIDVYKTINEMLDKMEAKAQAMQKQVA